MNDAFVEIKEWLENGKVAKRTINGIEYPLDEFPEALHIEVFKGVSITQFMSKEDALKIYGKNL